jgi:limonene-1,2-epoxide hydrolase
MIANGPMTRYAPGGRLDDRNRHKGRIISKTDALPKISGSEGVVHEFVAAFIAAWPSGDATPLARFFSEHAEYRTGPADSVHGRDAIVRSLTQMMVMGGEVDVQVIHLLSNGPTVMTERVDYWTSGDVTASLHVAGVFEVREGVITDWRDYFDPNEFASQLPGTVGGPS